MPRPPRAELLLPAGDLDRLKTALLYGADAVYCGTPDMSLRSHSGFTLSSLEEGITLCHSQGKRVYLTLNLFSHNRDVSRLPAYVATLRRLRPDGVIVADLGVFGYLRREAPELELHVSTQANAASWLTVQAWETQGASLVVLAREVSFEELQEIRLKCPTVRLEAFVHGSMCMTYSGRCLLSNYMAERGANQGSCAHSCRWKYRILARRRDDSVETLELTQEELKEYDFYLEEEFRGGQLFPIEEDSHGSYILNSKDLCLLPHLAEYLEAGIDSLKIEGRNKSEYYLSVVGRAYRTAIDAYYAGLAHPKGEAAFDPSPFLEELATVPSRGYTNGFHGGRLGPSAHSFDTSASLSHYEYAGRVREWQGDEVVVEVKNRLLSGDVLEFLVPGALRTLRLRLYEFADSETGCLSLKATAGEGRAIRIPASAFHQETSESLRALLPPLTVIRKGRSLRPEEQGELLRHHEQFHGEVHGELGSASHLTPRDEPSPFPNAPHRKPKLGAEGCCGRGCNGCLPFWNEPRFEEARNRLLEGGSARLPKSG